MSPEREKVILVDSYDREVGTMGKIDAHRFGGTLHRAFSIFIFNTKGKMLLQQRAISKYHSGGLFTNTCCSHPHPNEDVLSAANRRLQEEMGMNCDLKEIFSFEYRAALDHNLTEWELDHVFIGECDDIPRVNILEVESYKYVDVEWLLRDLASSPNRYTEWFKASIEKVIETRRDTLI
jgi:isopentenyl-diphosphate delta-isomerase